MQLFKSFLRLALVAAACCAGWAYAQDAPAPERVAFGKPLAPQELELYRGGFDSVKNDVQLNAAVNNNTAVNVLTGNNAIMDGSFANASGLPMVIQNSGSNVSIQNATVVNVQLQ